MLYKSSHFCDSSGILKGLSISFIAALLHVVFEMTTVCSPAQHVAFHCGFLIKKLKVTTNHSIPGPSNTVLFAEQRVSPSLLDVIFGATHC